MAERLSGKIALITGGASGLGLAIAEKFLSEGATVILTDINGDRVVDEASRLGGDTVGLAHDVSKEDDWQAIAAVVMERFGGLHILINNAGICVPANVEAVTLEEWRQTHAVNLDGVFLGCKYLLPVMADTTQRDGSSGSILNVSSISAMIASANTASYNSSKAAVCHLTKSVALHCAREGYVITCNSVHPTFIETPLLDSFVGGKDRAAVLGKMVRQIPLGRLGKPADVAWAAVYLCSDEASFVTGAELLVDGGVAAG